MVAPEKTVLAPSILYPSITIRALLSSQITCQKEKNNVEANGGQTSNLASQRVSYCRDSEDETSYPTKDRDSDKREWIKSWRK